VATQFTHEEEVMFDQLVAGFEDSLVIGQGATTFTPPSPDKMVHLGDKFWLPVPMIGATYDGFDQTANFGDLTEISVPVSVGYHKSAPKTLSAKNLRNAMAMTNYAKAAKQKLSSDINLALFNTVALQGSRFVKRTAAASGFDDIAAMDAAFTEIGIPNGDRLGFISPRDYNLMASDLAGRNEATTRSSSAYSKALINSDVAGFELYKNDQSVRLAAATGGAVLINGASQYHEPVASSTATTGEISNVDNRYSDIIVDGGTYANVKAGDAFTLTGVNSVHLITKQDTGQLQTFRVISKPASNTLRIAPAIISNEGATIAGKEYQNVTATPADDAPLTWLNTVTAAISPFFKRDSLLLIPGSFTVDPQDGWNVMRATTPGLGIAVTYTRQGDINDLSVKARFDIDFGTSLTDPLQAGAEMFSQS
jgi:hypothetical protein